MQIALHSPLWPNKPGYTQGMPQYPVRIKNRAHFGNNFLVQPIQMLMDPINNNRLVELFVSDFLGMTFPRTLIETRKRGADTGRETLFRELVGGITPVFLCGWLGSLWSLGLEKQFYNPKKMSFSSWIDSNLLNHFVNITNDVLPHAKTVGELKHKIVAKIIGQIHSTDGIYKLSEFRDFFPEKGVIPKPLQERITAGLLYSRPANPKAQAKLMERLARLATNEGALTHRVALMHPDGFPYMDVGPREMTDILGKAKNYLNEFVSKALGKAGNVSSNLITPALKNEINCRLFNETGKNWFSKFFVPRIADGVVPYIYKLKRVLLLPPLIATAMFAFSFAKINNWITSRKFEGHEFFPGEGIPPEYKYLEGARAER